ncbi:Sec-independent protein translocase subunit TatA [Ornithinimicrobium panacihumi]|uniref:Sec-independent protein translocase subunit TatA n=1 Tax=Ornithinimicrobium panacihumi TaxID=2008449 RepID=UPI003F8A2A0A
MGGIKIWHIVVLIIAFVVLFGWKNLPNAARSLGESMRVFKTEVDQMKDENAARKDKDAAGPPPLREGDHVADRGTDTDADGYRDTAREEYRRIEDERRDTDPRA